MRREDTTPTSKVFKFRDFPDGPVIKTPRLSMQGVRVPFLVRELRSYMLFRVAPPKKSLRV